MKETVEKTEATGNETFGKETAGAENSGTETSGTEITATEAAPGKLIRIKYAVSSGTAYGCDFSIDVTPQQIVSARFFSEEQMDYVLLEQEPLEEAQWKELERTVSELLPVLEEATSGVLKPSEVSDIIMLDGGDSFSFALTWEEEGKERRVEYRNTNDPRFITLIDLLKETADPTEVSNKTY